MSRGLASVQTQDNVSLPAGRQAPECYRIAAAAPGRVRIQFTGRLARRHAVTDAASHFSGAEHIQSVRSAADAFSVVLYIESGVSLGASVRLVEELASRFVESYVPSGSAPSRAGNGAKRANGFAVARGARAAVAILHSLPGRLSLHVPHLNSHPHIGEHIEAGLANHDGVLSVVTEPDTTSVTIHYNPAVFRPSRGLRVLRDLVHAAVRSPEGHEEIERAKDISEKESGLNPLVIPTIAVATSLIVGLPMAVGLTITAIAALPVAGRAFGALIQRKATVDQLDFGAIAVLMFLGDYFTASLMAWLIGLGDFIRSRTMRSSRRAISELLSPAGQMAWLERDGGLVSVPVEDLKMGDVVHVHPGDLLPVDGTVVEGRGILDCKILTGESVPVFREVGDTVFALTTMVDGRMSIRVEHIGRETRAGQVATLVEEAPLSDTRVQNYAAMLGDRLVIPIFALALGAYALSADLMRFASVLILDFATGIRVSAPTTILSSMISASRQGLFIKGGKAMEKLATVDAVVFDKTGTLTRGEPVVTELFVCESAYTRREMLHLAASAESKLKHPAATAVVRAAEEAGITVTAPDDMEYVIGHGVTAKVDGIDIQVGSRRFMGQLDIDTTEAAGFVTDRTASANSLVYVSSNGKLIGVIAYADPPRPESAEVILALRERGIKRIVMLTGDSATTAHAVASELLITDIIADAYPEQKAEVVERLRKEGYSVAVIGDGVNDSPAFTRADVGISLAGGADVAKETADVILLDNSLWGLPRAIDLARFAMHILRQNINVIVVPTIFGLSGAVLGISSPLISTIINNGTTVIAGLNALRPMVKSVDKGRRRKAFRIMERETGLIRSKDLDVKYEPSTR